MIILLKGNMITSSEFFVNIKYFLVVLEIPSEAILQMKIQSYKIFIYVVSCLGYRAYENEKAQSRYIITKFIFV